ncbi:hypothetical protein IFR05_014761 [Cadophora sp. M221]|nr:hypothetical protein IFR05_014761 [Cadophora sp. M221]
MAAKLLTLILLTLTTLTTAITIPANQTDGTYSVSLINGIEAHTKISDIDTTAPLVVPRSGLIGKRWPGDAAAKCNDDFLLSNDFYNGAYNGFWNQCGTRNGGNKVYNWGIYTKSGTAVA